ncbi:MAG: lysophospholipid acyltransferase family protein [Vicinamibacteria bacterium]
MGLLRALRSFVGVVLCLGVLGVMGPLLLYLYYAPRIAIQRNRANELGTEWVSWIARALVANLRLGGATFDIEGEIDCNQPGVVIMNHQSVLEIPPLVHILRPRLPRFVARSRYARAIPTVSRAIAYLDGIVIDPRRDRAGSVLAIQRAAEKGLQHTVMLFPEGHRTSDGEIAPFRPAGMIALLRVRPMPVWTIVGDGFWHHRKVMDTFFGLGQVRSRMKVVEKVMSPENPDDLPAFVEERRQTMIRELAKMRSEAAA